MQTVHRLFDLRDRISALKATGTVALVPTMGALHAGHMTLVESAASRATHVVVSIFVNPRQFGPKEDFSAYPRPAEADAALLKAAGVAVLWMPTVAEMYPEGYATNVSVATLGDGLCGAARPGHFDGVATVVAKLLNQVRPDIAFFGEKDWQQLAIIRRLAIDLDLGVEIAGVPIVREADGLALSSRNAYLSPDERVRAAELPAALSAAAARIEAGGAIEPALEQVHNRLKSAGFGPIDYVTLGGSSDLQPMDRLDRPARLFAAARIGKARLIDNWPVNPPQTK